MKISFVVPTYREESNIVEHYKECIKNFDLVRKIFPKYDEYEYLVIDNCSDDNTVEKVLSIREKDSNVILYINEENYGPVLSPFEGLIKSNGDVAMLIAADLQEPPSLLLKFIESIEEDYDCAIGLKKNKKENFFMWKLRGFYYLTLKLFGLVKIASRYSGFGLYKRELINKMKDNILDEPSLRILVPQKTNNYKSIKYEHQERYSGQSTYKFYDYIKEATKTIIRNSSKIPSFAAKLGLLLTFLSLSLIPFTIILKILFWQNLAPGIATIIILILILNSFYLLLISLVLDRQGQILSRLKPQNKSIKHKKIFN